MSTPESITLSTGIKTNSINNNTKNNMESLIAKIIEFKNKYFTNNFYWITEENHERLHLIGIEFGCINPNGEPSIIKWHDGFKNLGFRTYERNNCITKFQKEAFLVNNEEATNYNVMLKDYEALNEFIKEFKQSNQ